METVLMVESQDNLPPLLEVWLTILGIPLMTMT